MEVLQARDWKQCIDERQEVEQTIQRSYQTTQPNIRNVCSHEAQKCVTHQNLDKSHCSTAKSCPACSTDK